MFRKLVALFMVAVSLMVVGCGSNTVMQPNDKQQLQQQVEKLNHELGAWGYCSISHPGYQPWNQTYGYEQCMHDRGVK